MAIAKKKKDIKISFVDSPSSEDVTGSLIFISTPNHKILVDAGLHQTNDKYQDFLVNNRKYKEFKPKEIDYIFITHCHGDHCLLIPKLFKEGCKAKVILTAESAAVLKDMSMDCAEINQRDVLVINTQNNKSYSPLYIEEDVEKMMCNIDVQSVNEKVIIDNTLSYELIPAGHLLGSCQVLLHFNIDNVYKSILVTGDIGNKLVGNRFVGEYQQVKSADIVIAESTYGDKPSIKTGKKERKKRYQQI